MHMEDQNNVEIANGGSMGANLVVGPDSEAVMGEAQRLVSKLCRFNSEIQILREISRSAKRVQSLGDFYTYFEAKTPHFLIQSPLIK